MVRGGNDFTMLKKCVICKKQFNALKSAITCSEECGRINKLLWDKKYKKENPDYMTNWSKKHKEERQNYKHDYYLKNKKRLNKNRKTSYQKNREKELLTNKQWIKNNPEKRNNEKKAYYNKHKNEIKFKILLNLRSRISRFIKYPLKSESTSVLLGCSIEQLKTYIENKFTKGMSWKNYGTGWNGKGMQEWHIDHIIPCASFDLSKSVEQRKCFNYTNLQPLWAFDNISKGKKEN